MWGVCYNFKKTQGNSFNHLALLRCFFESVQKKNRIKVKRLLNWSHLLFLKAIFLLFILLLYVASWLKSGNCTSIYAIISLIIFLDPEVHYIYANNGTYSVLLSFSFRNDEVNGFFIRMWPRTQKLYNCLKCAHVTKDFQVKYKKSNYRLQSLTDLSDKALCQ